MKYRDPVLPASVRPRWETPDPPGVTGSYGPAVIAWAANELGLRFTPWQRYIAVKVLRHDKAGNLIHRVALFSTARQNGKSVIVRAFYGWLLDVGRTVGPFAEWRDIRAAAHDAKQARIIYRAVYDDLAGIPRLTKKAPPAHGRGERIIPPAVRLTRNLGIETDTLVLDTITSEPGSARGLSIGSLAFDEVLTQRDFGMFEAVRPTLIAQRSPIMLLTSTAGYADSVVLRQYYDRLKRQASGDEAATPTFYGAWWESSDPDAGLDWQQIRQANPALGQGQLGRDSIADEFRDFPKASWQRERLNHFVDVAAPGAFNPGTWARCRIREPLAGLEGPFALGVDVVPGWERGTVAVAAQRPDGRIGVEIFRDIRSTEEAPLSSERLLSAVDAFPDPFVSVGFDSVSGAAPEFIRRAASDGGDWRAYKPNEVVSACMDFTELVLSGRLAVDDPLLDAQIPLAARRPVGQDGAFRFSRAHSLGPIDAVLAAVFAVRGLRTLKPPPAIY